MPKLRFRSRQKEPATSEADVEEPYTDLESSRPSTATNMSSDTEIPAMEVSFDTILRPPRVSNPWPSMPPTGNPQQQDAADEEERRPAGIHRELYPTGSAGRNNWEPTLQQPAAASQKPQPANPAMASQILNMMPTPNIYKTGYTSERGTHFRKVPDNRPRREALEQFYSQQQAHQTCTRPHFEESQRKHKTGLNAKQPRQANLEAVEEEPSYATLKEASQKKSQQPSAHKQKYTAASAKKLTKSKGAYHSDESSHHQGYHSRDSVAFDFSDCRKALPSSQPAKKDGTRQARKSAQHKRAKGPKYSSSDSSDSEDSNKGRQGGDSKRDRKSPTTSPIRRALGKPQEWGDPSRGHHPIRNSFKTPPIKQFSGKDGEDPKEFLNQIYTAFALDHVDEDQQMFLFSRYLSGRALRWYESLDRKSQRNFGTIINAFSDNYIHTNVLLKEDKFHRLRQGSNHSVEQYIASFEELLPSAADKSEHGLKSKFISGLKSTIKNSVIMQRPQSFASAKELARLSESTQAPDSSMDVRALSGDPKVQNMFSDPGDLKQVLHELQSRSQQNQDSISAIEKSLAQISISLKQDFSREKDPSDSSRMRGSRNQRSNLRRNSNQADRAGKTCTQCKSEGHLKEECRKRQCGTSGSYHSFANPPGKECPKPQRQVSFIPAANNQEERQDALVNVQRLVRAMDFKTTQDDSFNMIGLKGLHSSTEMNWGCRTDSFTDLDETFQNVEEESASDDLDNTYTSTHSSELSTYHNISKGDGEDASISLMKECFPTFSKTYIKNCMDVNKGDWTKVTDHLLVLTDPVHLPRPNHLGDPPTLEEESSMELRAISEDFPDLEQRCIDDEWQTYDANCQLGTPSLPKLLNNEQPPTGTIHCLDFSMNDDESNPPPQDAVVPPSDPVPVTLISILASAVMMSRSLATASVGSNAVAISLRNSLSQAAMTADQMTWGAGSTFTWTLIDAADQADYIGGILRRITIDCNNLAQTITAGMANTNSVTTLRATVELTCDLQTDWLVTRDLMDELTNYPD
jgi:hypothetical protein